MQLVLNDGDSEVVTDWIIGGCVASNQIYGAAVPDSQSFQSNKKTLFLWINI